MPPIQYRTTDQGQQTRSLILRHIAPGEAVTRQQLVERSGLTYQQVRRQTQNLCLLGLLRSQVQSGKRVYRLNNEKKPVSGE